MDRALLVGINNYKGAQLQGCLNDISDMASVLTSKYGFKQEDVRLLADNRAVTSAILERLHWLVDVKPGDRCFFHYSGHGAQVATRDYKHEVDGLLEVICPFDFDWSAARMITDKMFFDIFSKIPPDVKFVWVSDSCHSGDLTRDMNRVTRAYPTPVDIAWRNSVAKAKKVKKRGLVNGVLDVGFVSGCKSNQTSADTVDSKGRPCGALTHYLINSINALPINTPLNKIVETTRQNLKHDGYEQEPQSEGARADKAIFG